MMSKPFVSIVAVFFAGNAQSHDNPEFWKTESFLNATPEEQAQTTLNNMNFTEKYSMTRGRGTDKPFTGHTMALPNVGIPQINMNDGP